MICRHLFIQIIVQLLHLKQFTLLRHNYGWIKKEITFFVNLGVLISTNAAHTAFR